MERALDQFAEYYKRRYAGREYPQDHYSALVLIGEHIAKMRSEIKETRELDVYIDKMYPKGSLPTDFKTRAPDKASA